MVLSDIPLTLPKQIATYVRKSNELEAIDPVMSYFCKLYAVEEILDSGIHTSDESVAQFAGELLDSVESQKKVDGEEEESSIVEIIKDKDLSITYVLNFADKIFNNCLKQITEKRSNKSTGFNLLTSVTFYEILRLWDDYEGFDAIIEADQLEKRKKYAKFHAARILKALKSGEDPNQYTAPEIEVKEDDEYVGDNDSIPIVEPDGSNSDGLGLPNVNPTIEQSRSPSLAPIAHRSTTTVEDDAEDGDLSGVLPNPPSFKPEHDIKTSGASIEESTTDFDNDLGLPSAPTHKKKPVADQTPTISTSPTAKRSSQPKERPIKQEKINIEEIVETSEIYTSAQKHAKFAISAMNYEDKETSIRELNNAIALLEKLQS